MAYEERGKRQTAEVDSTARRDLLEQDLGIDDKFMKELGGNHKSGSSVLSVLVKKAMPDRVLDGVKGTGGKILKTSLSHDDEAKLQAALSTAKQ